MRTGRMLLACIAACVMLLTAAGAQEKAEWKIGVCQLQQHAALEDATRGFMDAVDEILAILTAEGCSTKRRMHLVDGV